MSTNEYHIADILATLETAVSAAPMAELPALLGALEKIKAMGWVRTMQGPLNGQGEDELLTITQVAARLKLSTYRTYELCRQGRVKSLHLGKSIRVRPSAVTEYLQEA